MSPATSLLPGTLDMLILKALSLGERHGYGVLLRLQQMTGGAMTFEQGAVYPALYRLKRKRLVVTRWGTSENNRRARYYSLSADGRKQLRDETHSWNRLVGIMADALNRQPGEV